MPSAYIEGPVLPNYLCFTAPNIDCLWVEPDSRRTMAEPYISQFTLSDAASTLIFGAGVLKPRADLRRFRLSPLPFSLLIFVSCLKWNHGQATKLTAAFIRYTAICIVGSLHHRSIVGGLGYNSR